MNEYSVKAKTIWLTSVTYSSATNGEVVSISVAQQKVTSNGNITNRIAFESMALNDDFLVNPIVLSKMYSRYHQLAYYTIK